MSKKDIRDELTTLLAIAIRHKIGSIVNNGRSSQVRQLTNSCTSAIKFPDTLRGKQQALAFLTYLSQAIADNKEPHIAQQIFDLNIENYQPVIGLVAGHYEFATEE